MQPSGIPLHLGRLGRFAVSGLGATGLHVLVALSLIDLWLTPPPVANGIAFCLATAFSYLVNTLWSFNAKLAKTTLFRFITVSFVGLGLSIGLAWVAEFIGWPPLGGIALVVCVVPAVSFVMHSIWTYR